MKSFLRIKPNDTLILAFFCLVQTIVLYPHLQLDFWNDELYTIKHFVLVPITSTLTDFHVPNNHVFFNLINNVYLKINGIESLYQLMDAPWKLRLLPLLYSCLSGIYLYKLSKKLFNQHVASFSLIILLTTVPFYNFALQVRGYSLSMLWLVMIAYFCLIYFHFGKRQYLVYIVISVALAIYTLPLNFYFIASLLMVFIILFLNHKRVIKTKKQWINASCGESLLPISLSLLSGILLSIVFYSPILWQVLFNPYAEANYAPSFSNFRIVTVVLLSFDSKRYLLTTLAAIGFTLIITVKSDKKKLIIPTLSLLGLIIFPMIMSIIRNDHAPERAFVNLTPFFALFYAVTIHVVLEAWSIWHKYKPIVLSILVIYCFASLFWQKRIIEKHLYQDLQTGSRSQGLYYNYYLNHFTPLQEAKYFYENHYKQSDTIIILNAEPHGFTNYLDKFGIQWRWENDMANSPKKNNDKQYVVTTHPNQLLLESGILASYKYEVLGKALNYNNIIKFTKIDSSATP